MKKIICSLLLALPLSVSANTFVSQPGENIDQFIVRVAKSAVAMGRTHGVETCGAIGFKGEEHAITIHKGEKYSCEVTTTDVPEGYMATGEVFHTHPTSPKFSPADFLVPGYMANGSKVFHQHGEDTVRRVK